MQHHRQHPANATWPATAVPVGRRNPIGSIYGTTLLFLLPLLAVFVLAISIDRGFAEMFNRTAPVYFIGVMLFCAYRVIKTSADFIWAPAVWLPLNSAVFFGFGPLVQVFGSDETLYRLSVGPDAITEIELFRAHKLSILSVFCLFSGFWLHCRLSVRAWVSALEAPDRGFLRIFSTGTLATIFIVGGALLRYGVIRPANWGMTDVIVPGVLTTVSAIVDVGFGLAAFLAARGNKRMRWLLVMVWPVHIFFTSLSFAKAELVLALLLPAIGAYLGHRRRWRLGLSIMLIAVVYIFSQNFAQYGRAIIHADTGTITQASYGERIRIVRAYLTAETRNSTSTFSVADEGWWTRLNFAGPQTIAMNRYDQGRPGDTLTNVWMLFIPRAVWPGKPIFIGPGMNFREMVTGNPGGGYWALSVYGDLYWQFGWWGVILISPMIGWLFAMISWRSIRAIVMRDFIYLPAILIGLQMSILGLTKFLINGIIAAVPLYFGYLLIVNILKIIFKKKGRGLRGHDSFSERRAMLAHRRS